VVAKAFIKPPLHPLAFAAVQGCGRQGVAGSSGPHRLGPATACAEGGFWPSFAGTAYILGGHQSDLRETRTLISEPSCTFRVLLGARIVCSIELKDCVLAFLCSKLSSRFLFQSSVPVPVAAPDFYCIAALDVGFLRDGHELIKIMIVFPIFLFSFTLAG